MLKGASFIEEWIEEGEARGARRVLLRQLGKRFGALPASVTQQIDQMDATECEKLGARLLHAASLEDLGLPADGNSEARPSE